MSKKKQGKRSKRGAPGPPGPMGPKGPTGDVPPELDQQLDQIKERLEQLRGLVQLYLDAQGIPLSKAKR